MSNLSYSGGNALPSSASRAEAAYPGSNTLPTTTRSEKSNAGWGVVSLARTGGTIQLPVWYAITFADGVVGVAYSQQFDVSPAASPTVFALTGSLPAGLSLTNPGGDGNEGLISGTPTTAGTASFILTATNAYGAASKSFTLTIVTAAAGGPMPFHPTLTISPQ